MSFVEDKEREFELKQIRQDLGSLKEENKLLWSAYIDLSTQYSSLFGLITSIANEAGLNADEILDIAEKRKNEKIEELIEKVKAISPSFEMRGPLQ